MGGGRSNPPKIDFNVGGGGKLQSGKRKHTLNKANILYEITGSIKMSLKDARSEENI